MMTPELTPTVTFAAAFKGLQHVTRKQVAPKRSGKAFNPVARDEAQIFRALLDGRHIMREYSNPDIWQKLQDWPHLNASPIRGAKALTSPEFSIDVNAHGLSAPRSRTPRCWRLTRHGRI